MRWEVGLSTGIAYRHPIEEVLPRVRSHGFEAIEVSTAPPHLDIGDGARLRRLRGQIDDLGLRVHSLHAPFGHDVNLTSPDEGQRRESLHRLTLAADALAILGGGSTSSIPAAKTSAGSGTARTAWPRASKAWAACGARVATAA